MSIEGEVFPEFTLRDQYGLDLSSADLIGTKFILFTFPRAYTTGSNRLLLSLQSIHQTVIEAGIRLIGLSRDSHRNNRIFGSELGVKFSLLADPDMILLEELGLFYEMEYFGGNTVDIAKQTYFVNEDLRVVRVLKKVVPNIHGEQVLNVLAELGWSDENIYSHRRQREDINYRREKSIKERS